MSLIAAQILKDIIAEAAPQRVIAEAAVQLVVAVAAVQNIIAILADSIVIVGVISPSERAGRLSFIRHSHRCLSCHALILEPIWLRNCRTSPASQKDERPLLRSVGKSPFFISL